MRYKLLGRSGLRVSEVALGAMSFGEDWGWGVSKDESRAIFDTFVDAGGNFIDTAVNYTDGTSERFVGEFIAPERDYFVVATKYSLRDATANPHDPNAGGNHRKAMLRAVERSLRQLGTDYIDLYYLHIWDRLTPVDEVLRALDDLVRSGKVRYVGISDTPAWVISKANVLADLKGWSPFVAAQFKYSLALRDAERELIPMARSEDLAMVVWGVLDRGALTGKYRDAEATRRGDALTDHRVRMGEEVSALAGELGVTPAQVAIAWARAQVADGSPIIPLLGTRSATQLQDALGALELELGADHVARLAAASAFVPGFPQSFLTAERIDRVLFGETRPLIDDHRSTSGPGGRADR